MAYVKPDPATVDTVRDLLLSLAAVSPVHGAGHVIVQEDGHAFEVPDDLWALYEAHLASMADETPKRGPNRSRGTKNTDSE